MQCQQPMGRDYHNRVFELFLRQPFRLLSWTATRQLGRRRQLRRDYRLVALSGIFDAAFYLEQNPLIAQTGFDPLEHYLTSHGLERRDPNPLFNNDWYIQQNPDLAAGANPLVHYLQQGWKEGRNPHPLFDTAFYLQQNPDVAQAEINPLQHYLAHGGLEGRSPHPLFDGAWYLRQNPDLVTSAVNPLIHYLRQGWRKRRDPHPLFDTAFYLEEYSDVEEAATCPLQHYVTRGGLEGRNPHPLFDGAWYLAQSPDLVKEKINPLIHYLCQGWKDGPNPHRLFDTAFYLRQAAQIAAAEVNPLLHYLAAGATAGLNPNPLFDSFYYIGLYSSTLKPGTNPLIDYVLRGAAQFSHPHPLFDPAFYVTKHRDAETSGLDPLSHYLTIGARKHYSPHPLFDVGFYLEQTTGLNINCSDLLQHYLHEGAQTGLDPCELFDSSFYLEQNPKVAGAGLNPLSHYLMTGVSEGCDPNPLFDTSFYLKQNPAVVASGINPLIHFITYGSEEGRFPNPFFDPLYYLRNNPDVKRTGTNPLAHYLVRGGAQEGRDPSRFFSTTRYLSEHPELEHSDINPLAHFLGYHGPSGETTKRGILDCVPGAKATDDVAIDFKDRLERQGIDLLWAPASQAITVANEAFRLASGNNRHLLIMLAPIVPEENAISVLTEAFSIDPHFGAVVPRESDSATGEILKLGKELGDPELKSFPRGILNWVPEYYILHEILPACFLLRNSVLSNFDLLDETFETLAGALRHYLCRARRAGFRCAVVNRAIVSLASSEDGGEIPLTEADVRKLHAEYPDAGLAKAEFRDHSLHMHESLLARALPSQHAQRKLLLDIRGVPSQINGTTEAVLSLCDAFSGMNHRWAITLLAAAGPAQFHRLAERYPRWKIITKEGEQYFTAALRPSQPWDINSMIELHRMALFNFYTMLDTIAWDILLGKPPELDATWSFLSEHADGILYISQYTRDRFRARFPSSQMTPGYVSHLSFDPDDYVSQAVKSEPHDSNTFILVVGNSYDHKNVGPTVDLLNSRFPSHLIKVLGLRNHPGSHVVTLESGQIPQIDVDRLFAEAAIIVFPSFYEGFGFPILKGLSYSRSVIARQSGLLTEIASYYRGPGRLIAFRTPTELVEAVGRVLDGSEIAEVPLGGALDASGKPMDWTAVAGGVLGFIEERVQDVAASRWSARQSAIEQMTAYAI